MNGPELEIPDITKPLKKNKVNIWSEEETKFATIGDYWDEEIVNKVTKLLHEYWELFPTNFLEMKGIVGYLWVMKIPLKPDANSLKKMPYKLNLKYKEKVKIELDKMIEIGDIEPMEESKWVSPIEKKTQWEIKTCFDLRELNDEFLHDPFPPPFTNEVIDNVGGQEF